MRAGLELNRFDDPWAGLALGEVSNESMVPSLAAYGLPPGSPGYRLGDLRCAPGRDGVRVEGVYSESAVGVVLRGVFDYASEGRAGTAVPGALLFANRNETFACRNRCDGGNRRLVVFFGAGFLEGLAEELALDAARFPAAAAPPSPLTPTLSGLMLRIARGGDDGEAALAMAEAAMLGARDWPAAAAISVADRRRILGVVRHISANFADDCALDTLAAVAGMGRFRFARRFRAVTGETASQYVLNRRLSAAAAQLAVTTRPVSAIAYEVGFNDLSYFYARFRAAFGCAPGAWRRFRTG